MTVSWKVGRKQQGMKHMWPKMTKNWENCDYQCLQKEKKKNLNG